MLLISVLSAGTALSDISPNSTSLSSPLAGLMPLPAGVVRRKYTPLPRSFSCSPIESGSYVEWRVPRGGIKIKFKSGHFQNSGLIMSPQLVERELTIRDKELLSTSTHLLYLPLLSDLVGLLVVDEQVRRPSAFHPAFENGPVLLVCKWLLKQNEVRQWYVQI